jgi:hypothetical protein
VRTPLSAGIHLRIARASCGALATYFERLGRVSKADVEKHVEIHMTEMVILLFGYAYGKMHQPSA